MIRSRFLLVLLVMVAWPGAGQAGIYFTNEAPQLPLPTLAREIQFRLMDLRSIPVDQIQEDTPVRAYYRRQLAQLEARDPSTLRISDRINLGASYLRLRKPWDARRVLSEAEALCPSDHSERFLLLANLAVTFHLLAEQEQEPRYYDQAISYQRKALASWPELHPAWWMWQNQTFRRAELFYLELLRSRHREVLRNPGPKAFQWEQVDGVFEGVQFQGPGGEFVVGGPLDWNSWDRLPVDAHQVMLQLVFWFPYDDRLYWLYGEVLNVRNQVVEAYDVFTDLVEKRKVRIRTLMQHQRALEEPVRGRRTLAEQMSKDPSTLLQVMMAVAPRGTTGNWGLPSAAVESAWPVMAVLYEAQARPPEPPETPPGPRGPVDWQPIFIGFAAGVVVGILALLQMRQWRNRRGDSINERRLQES